MTTLTWAKARPMLYALKGLARMHATGAALSFPGGFTGTVENGQLILFHDDDIVFAQPVDWPLSKAGAPGPDAGQLTLDDEANAASGSGAAEAAS